MAHEFVCGYCGHGRHPKQCLEQGGEGERCPCLKCAPVEFVNGVRIMKLIELQQRNNVVLEALAASILEKIEPKGGPATTPGGLIVPGLR